MRRFEVIQFVSLNDNPYYLEYDESTDLIHVASDTNNDIYTFDRSLNLKYSINLNSSIKDKEYIQGIRAHKGKLFVLSGENIIIVENRAIRNVITGMCQPFFRGRLEFVNDDYMLVTCGYDNGLYLYHQNGTSTGQFIKVDTPRFLFKDPFGRYVCSGGRASTLSFQILYNN